MKSLSAIAVAFIFSLLAVGTMHTSGVQLAKAELAAVANAQTQVQASQPVSASHPIVFTVSEGGFTETASISVADARGNAIKPTRSSGYAPYFDLPRGSYTVFLETRGAFGHRGTAYARLQTGNGSYGLDQIRWTANGPYESRALKAVIQGTVLRGTASEDTQSIGFDTTILDSAQRPVRPISFALPAYRLKVGTYTMTLNLREIDDNEIDGVPLTVRATTGGYKIEFGNEVPVNNVTIKDFTLIDADRDRPIKNYEHMGEYAYWITSGELPTRNLNIVANVNGVAGSVVFKLTDPRGVVTTQVENGRPFSAVGDINGNYNGFAFQKGDYMLEAQVYSQPNGQGRLLTTRALKFSFADVVTTVTSPNGGEVWDAGSKVSITWKTNGSVPRVQIGLRDMRFDPNLSSGEYTLVREMANTGSYTFIVPANGVFGSLANGAPANGKNYKVIVYPVGSQFEAGDESNDTFTIRSSGTAPAIKVTAPKAGDTWYENNTYTIKWNPISSSFRGYYLVATCNKLTDVCYPGLGGGTSDEIPWNKTQFQGTLSPHVVNSDIVAQSGGSEANYRSNMFVQVLAVENNSKVAYGASGVFNVQRNSAPAEFKVISPNGGEQFVAGTTVMLDWRDTQMRPDTRYDVFLTRKNGGAYGVAGTVFGRSNMEWSVGSLQNGTQVAPGTEYYIQVVRQPSASLPSTYDQSDSAFTIKAVPSTTKPDLIIYDVNCTPVVPKVNEPITCTVTVENNSAVDVTRAFKVDVQGKTGTISSLPARARKSVTVANAFRLPEPGTYNLNFVVDVTNEVPEAAEDNNWYAKTFTVAATPVVPIITVISPNGGEVWNEGEDQRMTWRAVNSDGSEIPRIDQYVVDSSGTNVISAIYRANSGWDTWTPRGVQGQFKVKICQTGTNNCDQSDNWFTIRSSQTTDQRVDSFSLINADTDQVIAGYENIVGQKTINLASLPTRNLSVRANTSPSTVGSVSFELTDPNNTKTTRCESAKPYALAGDTNGNYDAWKPGIGVYKVLAGPMTQANCQGVKGSPAVLEITFTNSQASAAEHETATLVSTFERMLKHFRSQGQVAAVANAQMLTAEPIYNAVPAICPVLHDYDNVTFGSYSREVQQLQSDLAFSGFFDPNDVNGHFGKVTQEALEQARRACNQTGLLVQFVNSDSFKSFTAENAGERDQATYRIKFRVTAAGNDVVIDKSVMSSALLALEPGNGTHWVKGMGSFGATGVRAMTVTQTGAAETPGNPNVWTVRQGQSADFTLTVVLEAVQDGTASVQLTAINWGTNLTDTTPDNFYTTNLQDFVTDLIQLNVF
jgi:hypothetical protein